MMRNIHLGIRLHFSTEAERRYSEDILLRLLGVISLRDLQYLIDHPDTKPLYDSGVLYAPPDQVDRPGVTSRKLLKLTSLLEDMGLDAQTGSMIVDMAKGIEVFLDTPSLYQRGRGDCNELTPVRIAELWRAGIDASPYLVKQANSRGGWTYHALVLWPDGSSEDPSLILGMGGPGRADERAEEIRKNKERWDHYMAAAQELIRAERSSPVAMGQQLSQLGLLPRDGFFRSPYPRAVRRAA